MKSAVAAFLALAAQLAIATHASAGLLEDGLGAFDHRDYATARAILEPLAGQGNADAQLAMGMLYRNGWAVKQDTALAAQWIGKAASGGNHRAEYIYGNLNFDGEGVEKDIDATVKWYRLSAEGGYPEGMTALAKMYSFGLGLPRDYREAYFWYSLALQNGVKGAEDAAAARDRMASRLSKDEIDEVDLRMKSWKAPTN